MNIKPIKNENDYDAALAAIDRLMVLRYADTPQGDELEIFVKLVEALRGRDDGPWI